MVRFKVGKLVFNRRATSNKMQRKMLAFYSINNMKWKITLNMSTGSWRLRIQFLNDWLIFALGIWRLRGRNFIVIIITSWLVNSVRFHVRTGYNNNTNLILFVYMLKPPHVRHQNTASRVAHNLAVKCRSGDCAHPTGLSHAQAYEPYSIWLSIPVFFGLTGIASFRRIAILGW